MADFARDRIARLRWHGGGDALAARRVSERALDQVECGWRGDAILCVRRLRATLRPGRPPAGAGPWREQVRSLAAGAARPWREAVPADAQAVLFADEAEMLACLARDAAAGAASAAWWWPALLGAPASRALVLRRWHAVPTLLPWSLQRLEQSGELAQVLGFAGEAEADALVGRLASVFAIAVPCAPPALEEEAGRAHSCIPLALASEWQALLRQVVQVLGAAAWSRAPARARLVAMAIAITRKPRLARAAGFGGALRAEGGTARPSVTPIQWHAFARERLGSEGQAIPGARPLAGGQGHAPGGAPAPGEVPPAPMQEDAARAAFALDADDAVPTPPAASREEAPSAPAATAAVADPLASLAAAVAPTPARRMQGLHTAADERGAPPALRVLSAFAGSFYLLPVAVHLGWYGDFTQPRAPGLALHPADLLALLGERIAGAAWAQDGLAALLACWAGRAPDEPAGLGFDPGEPLPSWLVAREAMLAERAAAALAMPTAEVLPWLAQREGVVTLGEQRLDVHFDLAAHPLAIRMAGLDRDLGWLPAGGRSIAFHFELGLPR